MSSVNHLKALLFFYFSAMTIIISYLPIYFQELGLTGTEIGFLLAVGPFSAMLAQPFWGFMIDKYKTSKRIIAICLIGAVVSSIFVFLKINYTLLLVAVFIFFAFLSPIGGLGDSLAQKTASKLSISFGSIRTWGSVGFAVMSLLIGYVLAIIGVKFMYIPFIFFALIAFYFVLKVKDYEGSKEPIKFRDTLKLGKNGKLIFFLFLMLFITITHRTNDSFLGLYIVEKGGNEALIGWAWFIGVISEAAVFATAVYWFKRFHPLTFIIISALLFSIRWFLMGILQEPLLILPLQVFHGLTFGIFYLSAFQYVSDLIPDELLSTGHLLFYSFFFGLSGMIGSGIGGLVIEHYSASILYSYLTYVTLVGALLLAIYKIVYSKEVLHSN